MIGEFALSIVVMIMNLIFAISGVLPQVPNGVTSTINAVMDKILDGFNLFSVFIDVQFVMICLPIAIAIINFEKIISLVVWILKKIPFLSIK